MTFFTMFGLILAIVNFEYDQIEYNKLKLDDLNKEIKEVTAMET